MEIEMIITYSKTLGNDAARHCYPRRDLLHLPIDQPRRRRHPPLQTAAAAAAVGFDASNKSDLRQNPWLFEKYYYLLFTESEVIARRNYDMWNYVMVMSFSIWREEIQNRNRLLDLAGRIPRGPTCPSLQLYSLSLASVLCCFMIISSFYNMYLIAWYTSTLNIITNSIGHIIS